MRLFSAEEIGVTDSEGKVIQEGDIIKEWHNMRRDNCDIAQGKVIYNNGSFMIDFGALNNGRLGAYEIRTRKPTETNGRFWLVVKSIYD